MKKIKIANGIKTSLANIINRSQDIFTGNYSELISQVFSPGFFIRKKTNNQLETDFEPSKITFGSDDLIQITNRGRNPSYAFTTGGKIISLNDIIKIDPRDIRGYSYYNTGAVTNVNTLYELWVIPNEVNTESVDYLPNYKITGETKPFVTSYVVGLLLIKKGQTPPPPSIYELDSEGQPIPGQPRGIPSVEGLKLCEFTYNPSTTTITGLTDMRLLSRAYLRPELYDFFNEAYLKHDYLLTHSPDSAGNNVLSFNKNGINDPLLNGLLSLVASKERVVSGDIVYPSRINVAVNNLPIPLNSVLCVTITTEDYSSMIVSKTLEVIPLNEFVPSVDKILIGYHLRTFLPNGNGEDAPEGTTDVIGNIGGDDGVPAVNLEPSTIYFINGLPPLPPGQNISRNGIASYILTKDEAAAGYYNKIDSDARFINAGNVNNRTMEYFYNNLFHMIIANYSNSYIGTKFSGEIPQGIDFGYAWINSSNAPIGYMIRRAIDETSGVVEIGLYNNDGTNLQAFRLENGFLKLIGSNPYPANDSNNLLTVAYGLLNRGDEARGNYDFKVGNLRFYAPTEAYESGTEGEIDAGGLYAGNQVTLIAEFIYDTTSDVFCDLKNHIITGSKDPRPGDTGKRDLVAREYMDGELDALETKLDDKFDSLIKGVGEFDAIVKNGELLYAYEFNTVADAILANSEIARTGLRISKIHIYPGEYDAENFWPKDIDPIGVPIYVEGFNRVIVKGSSEFCFNNYTRDIKISGIRFESVTNTNTKLLTIGSGSSSASNIEIYNCDFIGNQYDATTEWLGSIGIDLSYIINNAIINKCTFIQNKIGIGPDTATTLGVWIGIIPIKITNCVFKDNVIGIAPLFDRSFIISGNSFSRDLNSSLLAYIAFGTLEIVGTSGSSTMLYTKGFGFDFNSVEPTTLQAYGNCIISNNLFEDSHTAYEFSGCIHISPFYRGGIKCARGRILIQNNIFAGQHDASSLTFSQRTGGTNLAATDPFKISIAGNIFNDYAWTTPSADFLINPGLNLTELNQLNGRDSGVAGNRSYYVQFITGNLDSGYFFSTPTTAHILTLNM